ncbi:MAG: hypothetical protein COA82_09775 [Alkaliphilus sp.]|nr:MAG: hypothetical protein COA82_09775 [Alkaliphilus sp.]
MLKKISFPNRKKEEEKDLYETCVICKSMTNIRKNQHIEERYGYVQAIGQVCYDCYKKIENKPREK